MKKLIIRLGLFLAPLTVFFVGGEYIITTGLQKTNYDFYNEWNEITKGKVNADIIINGSSRAWVHVSPQILDSALKVNSYNLGFNDLGMSSQYYKYQEYLAHNTPPKMIIQTLDVFTLKSRDYLFDAAQYLPFFSHQNIRNCTSQSGLFSTPDFYIPLVRYFKYRKTALLGFKEFFNPTNYPNTRYKGFQGMDLTWKPVQVSQANAQVLHLEKVIKIADAEIKLMERFLAECRQQKIQVVLVYTPEFIEGQDHHKNRMDVMKTYQQIAQKYQVKLLDYSQDTISYQKNLFYNVQHLNKKGAEIFSKKLATDLKKLPKIP